MFPAHLKNTGVSTRRTLCVWTGVGDNTLTLWFWFVSQGNLVDFLRLTGWRGSKVLYFGDHLYSDLAVSVDPVQLYFINLTFFRVFTIFVALTSSRFVLFLFFCPVLNDSTYRMKNVNAHCGFRVGLEKRTFLTTLGGTDCFRHAPHVTRPQTKKAKTYPVPHTVQRLGRVRFIKTTCETIRKTFLSRLRFDFLKIFTKKTRG